VCSALDHTYAYRLSPFGHSVSFGTLYELTILSSALVTIYSLAPKAARSMIMLQAMSSKVVTGGGALVRYHVAGMLWVALDMAANGN